MLNLAGWWVLLLLPLPLLARRLLPPARITSQSISVPLLNRYPILPSALSASGARQVQACLWFFWTCIVLSAAQPYWLGDPISRTVSGRDLLLAIDISGSMREVDMTLNGKVASRIDVLKSVASGFIDRRKGDRIGLILFGSRAYSYVPLTYDRQALRQLLNDISTGLAGRLTAIGDAIGIAVKTLSQQKSRHKVLILVTDGSNTSGVSDPLVSAQIAAKVGMKIHTIGVGNNEMELRQLFNQSVIQPGMALNEGVLQQIAAISGGAYFRAKDEVSLENIYQVLDQLEPVPLEVHQHRPRTELFYLPLMFGMGGLLLSLTYRNFQSTRRQRQ